MLYSALPCLLSRQYSRCASCLRACNISMSLQVNLAQYHYINLLLFSFHGNSPLNSRTWNSRPNKKANLRHFGTSYCLIWSEVIKFTLDAILLFANKMQHVTTINKSTCSTWRLLTNQLAAYWVMKTARWIPLSLWNFVVDDLYL